MRRSLGALGAVILSLAVSRCASHRPTASPPPPAATPEAAGTPGPTPVAREAFRSLPSAEPVLLGLEDRRAFDGALLDAAASSTDTAVRARAALALGRIGDERAVEPLQRLLSDPEPRVRETAAFSAAILRQPSLTASLATLLADPDDAVAARAAWATGFLEQPAGQAALIQAIAGAPAVRRPALLLALWRFPTPEAAAAAAPYAADSDPAIRRAALYALARRPQESSRPHLTKCLADPDADAAALCARALGVLGTGASLGPLWGALDDRRPPVAINTMLGLAAILEKTPAPAPAGKAARLVALAADANPNLAVPALALLRFATEDREAFRRLWSTASSGQGRRRQVAVVAAMAALPDQASELAAATAASTDPFVRGAAARGLGFLPEAAARPLRERLWSDPEAVVRLKVLEGLETPESIRTNLAIVDAALADPDSGVRSTALDLKVEAGGPDVYALLRETVVASYTEKSPDIPITAIGAAEKKPDDAAARAVVEAAYRHPSVLVARLARRSLVGVFHADPAEFPWKTYDTGKSEADYAGILASAAQRWTATVETARGGFAIRFAGDDAPMTVMNFVALAKKGYFDGAPIHRVVPNFVVQDGDPTGTGSGGPGYEIRDELNMRAYRTGAVGMALSGPDTGGSQWFVTQSPQPHLDGGYTVFGQVVSGMDVVNRIEQDDRIRRVTVSKGGS